MEKEADITCFKVIFLKTTVFWDAAPCSLVEITDVSKVLTVSINRSMSPDGCSKLVVW
jgi:hypothetical protein